MIHVEVTVQVNAPQQLVWEEITNWERHSEWIPFTKVTILDHGKDDKVGTKFVGRTGIGKLAFDDIMTVDRCVSPEESGEDGKCWITKSSPHLHGNAYFHVIETSETTSKIVWVENVSLPSESLTRQFSSILSAFGNIAFSYSLRKFAKKISRQYRASQ